MVYLKSLLASLFPFAIAESFFYFINNGAPFQLSDTWLKIWTVTAIMVCSNVGQMLILGRPSKRYLLRALNVNLTMWAGFWFLYTVDGFTVHKGLAKDAERSVSAFVMHFGYSFLIFGIPLTLFNCLSAALLRRLLNPFDEHGKQKGTG